MRVSKYFILGLGTALVAAGIATKLHFRHLAAKKHVGQLHTFELPGRPQVLAEDLALAKATESLALDGFDPVAWHAVRQGRTTSPDGRRDEYLIRNSDVTSRGVIMFTNGSAPPRVVFVGLDRGRLLCQGSGGER